MHKGGLGRFLVRHGALGIGIPFGILSTCYAELVRGSHLLPSPLGSFLVRLALSVLFIGPAFGIGLAAISWWLWFEQHGRETNRS